MKIILVLALSLASLSAHARCRVVQRCDDYNQNCEETRLCESSLDIPAVGIAPLPPVRLPGIRPIEPIGIPPIGTSDCSMQNINGRWQRVCQ